MTTPDGVQESIVDSTAMKWIPLGEGEWFNAGNVDSWAAVGDQDCVVSIVVVGAMEYLDEDDRVFEGDDTASLLATCLQWCEETGTEPDPRLDITPHRVTGG